jgi:hypothetical protein
MPAELQGRNFLNGLVFDCVSVAVIQELFQ